MKRPIFLLVVLFLSSLSCGAETVTVDECVLEIVTSYQGGQPYREGAEDLLRLYRQDPAFLGWARNTEGYVSLDDVFDKYQAALASSLAVEPAPPVSVDLCGSDRELDAPSEYSVHNWWRPRYPYLIPEYDARVYLLREGDTVNFSDRSFTLGKFLRATELGQVWELADSESLILIPVIGTTAGANGSSSWGGAASSRLFMRDQLKLWLENRSTRSDILNSELQETCAGFEYAIFAGH